MGHDAPWLCGYPVHGVSSETEWASISAGLIRAIEEYQVKGIKTTLPFGKWALQQPAFIEGNFDTNFINKYFTPQSLLTNETDINKLAAILAAYVWQQNNINLQEAAVSSNPRESAWKKRNMLR